MCGPLHGSCSTAGGMAHNVPRSLRNAVVTATQTSSVFLISSFCIYPAMFAHVFRVFSQSRCEFRVLVSTDYGIVHRHCSRHHRGGGGLRSDRGVCAEQGVEATTATFSVRLCRYRQKQMDSWRTKARLIWFTICVTYRPDRVRVFCVLFSAGRPLCRLVGVVGSTVSHVHHK